MIVFILNSMIVFILNTMIVFILFNWHISHGKVHLLAASSIFLNFQDARQEDFFFKLTSSKNCNGKPICYILCKSLVCWSPAFSVGRCAHEFIEIQTFTRVIFFIIFAYYQVAVGFCTDYEQIKHHGECCSKYVSWHILDIIIGWYKLLLLVINIELLFSFKSYLLIISILISYSYSKCKTTNLFNTKILSFYSFF